MSKIAFLGAGNMAAAMVEGLINSKAAAPTDILCYSASGRSAQALAARTGIQQATSLEDLTAEADTLIIAFKPQHLSTADAALTALTSGKLVISVLSGKRLETLSKVFPQARNVIRTMPNTPSQIGAGITPWCAARALSIEDRDTIESLLTAMGRQLEIAEDMMDSATAVSGSGAGFVFEFAGALCAAAENAGFDAETARTLSIETLLGSARLLARSPDSPETLRNKVASPNGTTEAGLNRMAEGDLRGLIRDTIEAARLRAIEVSQET